MNPTIIRLFFAAVVLLQTGCASKEDPVILGLNTGMHLSPHLIQTYSIPYDIAPVLLTDPGATAIGVAFPGEELQCSHGTDADKARYMALATRYNDLNYNMGTYPGEHKSMAEKLEALDVTCTPAFDATHQAGASIADRLVFCGNSVFSFIQNGYKTIVETLDIPEAWKHSYHPDPGYNFLSVPLNELGGQERLQLLSPACYLFFTSLPEPGEYTFTVTATIGGKKMTKSVSHAFE